MKMSCQKVKLFFRGIAENSLPLPEFLQAVGTGVLLGLSIAAPPGPINATIATQVATRSWFAGFLVGLGALTADATFFLITFYGLTRAIVGNEIGTALFAVGGLIMLFMAFSTFKSARSKAGMKTGRQTRFPYLIGLSIGLTNPFQIGWWVTVGLGVLATFGLRILVGFFAGISLWVLAYTTSLAWAVSKYYRLYPYINYASAIALSAFGLWFLLTASLMLL